MDDLTQRALTDAAGYLRRWSKKFGTNADGLVKRELETVARPLYEWERAYLRAVKAIEDLRDAGKHVKESDTSA